MKTIHQQAIKKQPQYEEVTNQTSISSQVKEEQSVRGMPSAESDVDLPENAHEV